MEDATVSLRFALLLEAYLRGASFHMDDLVKQNDVMLKLCGVADSIKRVKTTAEKKETLQVELDQCRLPTPFSLSLDPKLETGSLILEKCKYMDSKKVHRRRKKPSNFFSSLTFHFTQLPLWLVFNNHDATGSDIFIIFKSGDDLRQDMLTLQMIRVGRWYYLNR